MFCHKMMAEEWQDKRPVTILTMMHDNNGTIDQERQAGKEEPVKKPKPVLHYNKCMGGWTEWTSSLHPTLSYAAI